MDSSWWYQQTCTYGVNCGRTNCAFQHPHGKNVIICKYVGYCTRLNCWYKHTTNGDTTTGAMFVKQENQNIFNI